MRVALPTPRLLPVTIGVLGLLLAVKSVGLLRGALEFSGGGGVFGSRAEASEKTPPAAAVEKGKSAAAVPVVVAPAVAVPASVAPAVVVETPGPPPMTDSEKTLLLDLRQRRQDLESREATMNSREAVLTAMEQKLGGRVAELQALQKRLEGLEDTRRQREDASWQGLVKLYETMKPRDSATIFNDLGMPTLLEVVDRMKEAKAAPIIAAMVPEKARDLTTQLARIRLARAASPDTRRAGG